MPTDRIAEPAPAKVNLALHVTGRRADGYHLLDSLVVFAATGDRVTAMPGQGLTLAIDGPEAGGLIGDASNLVLRAARELGVTDAALHLWKALPVASGIGGGSADAAAALRALVRLLGKPLPCDAAVLRLGADVPVCLAGRPARMAGVGEVLAPLPPLPPLWLVLANPRVAVPTPAVFAALAARTNPPLPVLPPGGWPRACAFAEWLQAHSRNDLWPAALRIAPVLAKVRAALAATPGCLLARMSGSGATCFGLYADRATAAAAAQALAVGHPGWWVADSAVLP